MGTQNLLELRGVTVSRGGRDVLSCLDLTIPEGRNVAILGANGSGKSTLLKLISRELYAKPGGQCRVLGQTRWNVWDLRSQLGIVSAELQYALDASLTAREIVLSGFSGHTGYDRTRKSGGAEAAAAQEALCRCGATHIADREFSQLSSGEARRVMIARALAHRPRALIFDEPTTSLDIVAAAGLLQTMRQLCREGVQLVLVTHHFEELIPELDRVVLLSEGRIIADGSPQKVLHGPEIAVAFGASISVSGEGPYRAAVTL